MTSSRRRPAKPRLLALTASLRANVDLSGPDVALLEGIGALGTVAQAARSVGLSYRQALNVLDRLNRQFRSPLTRTVAGGLGGGQSALSELGQEVVTTFRRMERQANDAAAPHHLALQAMLAPELRDLDLSARNVVEGKVISIKTDKILSLITFSMNNGETMSAIVTNDSAKDLRIRRGMKIKGVFKADKVILVKP